MKKLSDCFDVARYFHRLLRKSAKHKVVDVGGKSLLCASGRSLLVKGA
jgi:hypothetical protein